MFVVCHTDDPYRVILKDGYTKEHSTDYVNASHITVRNYDILIVCCKAFNTAFAI